MGGLSIAGLRRELDHDGCAYGQVSRERLDNLAERLDGVGEGVETLERKLNYVLGAAALQLFAFLLGVVAYILQRS
jgi:hypothetical protein